MTTTFSVKWLFLKITVSEEWYDCMQRVDSFMQNDADSVKIASKANTRHKPIIQNIIIMISN